MSKFRDFFYEAYDIGQSDKGKFKKKSLFKVKKKSNFDLPVNTKYKLGKRPNKTQQARDFLFKKHNVKKAKARVNGKYVLDHVQIKHLMKSMGLDFSPKAGKWVIGAQKKDTPSSDPQAHAHLLRDIQKKLQKQKQDVLDKLPPPRDPGAPPAPPIENLIEVPDEFDDVKEFEQQEFESKFVKGKDDEIYHITEREVMIFQARFLLGLIWEEYSYCEYKLEPDGEVWATQSRGDTLRAMDALTMKWDPLDDTWHTSKGVQVFRLRMQHNEVKKSVVGRGLLANMNFINFIEFDLTTKQPKMSIDEVKEQLEKQEFRWDDSGEVWYYTGTDHRADFGNISHGEEK